MSGHLVSRYANQSFPPEHRAAFFVDGEPRLTWVSLFYDAFPDANVYLVGGTLRDVLLGRVPKDVDIVIRGVTIDAIQSWLRRNGACEIAGKRFGTFKFVPHGTGIKQPIDIALPRRETVGEEHFSGRSDLDVQFDPALPIEDDLSRRDFTVNAMAFDIRACALIDPWGGMNDLINERIRAVHTPSERFFEDATRMLRGLRLASQLSFSIEEHTWQAIRDFIHLLNTTRPTEAGAHAYAIPREAIGREFLLGFAVHPTHTLSLWQESGALHLFMPAIAQLANIVEADGETAFKKTLHLLHLLKKKSLLTEHKRTKANATTLVAGLFAFYESDLKTLALDVCKRLFFYQFPKSDSAFVDCKDAIWMVERIRLFEQEDPASMRPSTFEDTFCTERGRNLLLLMHATAIASGTHSVARERLHTARRIAERMTASVCPDGKRLPELISGNDLKTLGIAEGPHYRELKNIVRDAQITKRIETKEDALHLVRHHMKG